MPYPAGDAPQAGGLRPSPGQNRDGEPGPAPAAPARDDEAVLQAVRALQAGAGPEAFRPIFLRYFRPLQTFFAKQPALQTEADDLAQETLVRALQRIEQFRFQASFGSWLRHIAENVWKNAVRDRGAAKRGPEAESLEAVRLDDRREVAVVQSVYGQAERTPEERILAEERTRVLHRALEQLPPAMRRCAELRLGHDLQYNEIARVTGISLNSVKSQLFEARQRLRPILEHYFGGADL